jgi:MFS superfamily sulfate permease-like transporter
MGLYTIIPPLLAYALLGTSRLLVVGPDTATGLISALGVGAVVAHGTAADFNTLTSTLAILIGVFFLLFGALRVGWVAAFIPTPVMRGVHRRSHLRHHYWSGAALAGDQRHFGQLLHQALVRAQSSI